MCIYIYVYIYIYICVCTYYVLIILMVSQLQSSLNTTWHPLLLWEELFGIRLGASLNQTARVHAKLNGALHAVARRVVLVSEEGRHSTELGCHRCLSKWPQNC